MSTCYHARAIMDGDWLNRTGIFVEGVAFVLLAPEIMGRRRLARLEKSLEDWLPGVIPVFEFDELGGALAGVGRRAIRASLMLVISGLPWITLVLLSVFIGDTVDLIGSAVLLFIYAVGAVMLCTMFIDQNFVKRTSGGFTSWVPVWLQYTIIAGSAMLGGLALRVIGQMLRSQLRLLAGRHRLRQLVFAIGAVLLFSSLGAQCATTF